MGRPVSLCSLFLVVAATAAIAPAGEAQAPRPQKQSVITPTRTAVLFGGLERDVADALKKKDVAALDRLLKEDFELLAAGHPEDPVAREEWQEAVLAAPPTAYRIAGVSVREVGTSAALASFSYEQESKDAGVTGRFTFVDLWVRAAGRWRLQTRYAASAAPAAVPGWAESGAVDKRY